MGTHPIFESGFDCLTDVLIMPSFLGGYARATLKAAVINAENRNRLTEEDKCWREKNEKDSRKKSRKIERGEPNTTIERIKSKRHIDKWDHDGFYENHPEEIGPTAPVEKNTDRFRFFKAAPDVAITQRAMNDKEKARRKRHYSDSDSESPERSRKSSKKPKKSKKHKKSKSDSKESRLKSR